MADVVLQGKGWYMAMLIGAGTTPEGHAGTSVLCPQTEGNVGKMCQPCT